MVTPSGGDAPASRKTTIPAIALAAALSFAAVPAQARDEPTWQADWAYVRAAGVATCIVEHAIPGAAIIRVARVVLADGVGVGGLVIEGRHAPVRKIYVIVGDWQFSGDGSILMTPELLAALRGEDRLYVGWSSSGDHHQADVALTGFAALYDQCTAILERLRREGTR